MSGAWELLDERNGSGGHLPVVVRRYRLPDGQSAEWDVFGHDQMVAVLAITADDEIVLARQYRPGPERIAGEVSVVGQTWLASACRTRRFVCVARDVTRLGEPRNEPGEHTTVVLVPLARFREHLRSGALTDVDLGYLALDHLGLLCS